MAKLEILFSGLCAFVPTSESETPAVTVLLVNTASPLCKKLSKLPEPHYPVLQFDMANLKGVGTTGVHGSTQGLWLLDSEQVRFEIGGNGSTAPMKKGVTFNRGTGFAKGAGSNFPAKDQEGFFDWVPKIEDVLPGEGDVSQESMEGIADDGPSVARVELMGGTLSSRKVGKFMDQPVVAQFVPPGPSPQAQALASTVVFQSDDLPEDFEVTFSASHFSDGETRSVTLSPRFDADLNAGLVRIQITNICGGSFVEDPDNPNRLRLLANRILSSADEDFESFYILCKNFDTFQAQYTRLPIPTFTQYPLKVVASLGGEGGGIDTVRCNVTQFNAYKTSQHS